MNYEIISSSSSPGHISKRCFTIPQGHMLHYVHSSLISNIQKLERTQMSLREHGWTRMDTENVFIYTMEYYSTIKNKDIMNFAGKWMELENTILSEVTQTQKNMHDMYSLISGL